MNKVKYRTNIYFNRFHSIEKILIEKETKISVQIKGHWYRKKTNYNRHFDTFEDAKIFMIDDTKKRLGKAEQVVVDRKKELLTVQNMTIKNSLIDTL